MPSTREKANSPDCRRSRHADSGARVQRGPCQRTDTRAACRAQWAPDANTAVSSPPLAGDPPKYRRSRRRCAPCRPHSGQKCPETFTHTKAKTCCYCMGELVGNSILLRTNERNLNTIQNTIRTELHQRRTRKDCRQCGCQSIETPPEEARDA